MKLSEHTINILKNFSNINPMLLVNPGGSLTTMNINKSIFASADVEEKFPSQFAIFELPKFLGVLSLFKEPELEFGSKQVKIVSDRQSVNYTFADPSMIVAPDPNKNINFPVADVEFSISQEELQRVVRATAVLQLPDIAVVGDGENISITATNSKNPTTDGFSIVVGDTDKSFSMYFEVADIIKLISSDYKVKISSKGLSQWRSDNVLYYVAVKANSSFTN
jgi:hypothetical protein